MRVFRIRASFVRIRVDKSLAYRTRKRIGRLLLAQTCRPRVGFFSLENVRFGDFPPGHHEAVNDRFGEASIQQPQLVRRSVDRTGKHLQFMDLLKSSLQARAAELRDTFS